MLRILLIVALAAIGIAVASCAGLNIDGQHAPDVEQQQQLRAQSAAAMRDCDINYPPGQQRTAIARAKCQVDAIATLRPVTPYPDLMDQFLTTRMLVGEKVQNGKMTIAEANVVLAQKRSELISEEQSRIRFKERDIRQRQWEASHVTSQAPAQQPATDAYPIACIKISVSMSVCD